MKKFSLNKTIIVEKKSETGMWVADSSQRLKRLMLLPPPLAHNTFHGTSCKVINYDKHKIDLW